MDEQLYQSLIEKTLNYKTTKEETLIYFNKIWNEAFKSDFDTKKFDVIRSNGDIDQDWTIYNPHKHGTEKILPIEIGQFGNLMVTMAKISNNNQIITKQIQLDELKKQAFEKKYSEYGNYWFLNYFPNYTNSYESEED